MITREAFWPALNERCVGLEFWSVYHDDCMCNSLELEVGALIADSSSVDYAVESTAVAQNGSLIWSQGNVQQVIGLV